MKLTNRYLEEEGNGHQARCRVIELEKRTYFIKGRKFDLICSTVYCSLYIQY